ncbi:MAG: hypothetical protein NTX56_04140 [Proteobacteria bacterium]|nr:hypothetical protein [Pseudomonadota bacterium]
MQRTILSQQEKYIAFRRAHQTINECIRAENYIAAYVISFSLIEDRVNAMYVVWHRASKGQDPTAKDIRGSFTVKVRALKSATVLSAAETSLLLVEAKNRNDLLHQAMWNLNVFSSVIAERAVALTRVLEKARNSQKKRYISISSQP